MNFGGDHSNSFQAEPLIACRPDDSGFSGPFYGVALRVVAGDRTGSPVSGHGSGCNRRGSTGFSGESLVPQVERSRKKLFRTD